MYNDLMQDDKGVRQWHQRFLEYLDWRMEQEERGGSLDYDPSLRFPERYWEATCLSDWVVVFLGFFEEGQRVFHQVARAEFHYLFARIYTVDAVALSRGVILDRREDTSDNPLQPVMEQRLRHDDSLVSEDDESSKEDIRKALHDYRMQRLVRGAVGQNPFFDADAE
jgi:hypothetical protein